MAGFVLKNILSENGTVTSGVCIRDKNDMFIRIKETKDIGYNKDGKLTCENKETMSILSEDTPVSMNMWAGYSEFIDCLEKGFIDFLKENGNFHDAEHILPGIIDNLLQHDKAIVKVMKTLDKWIGITYSKDTKLAY